mgnify:CR=1 FL=1
MARAKILIIDDSADTRLLLGARLKTANHIPVFAADAYQAFTMVRSEQPNVILLDLGLPGGGGFTVLQRLKTLSGLGAVPIIIVTADGSQATQMKALEAGATGFLVKPVDTPKLLEAVAAALEESGFNVSLNPDKRAVHES